MSGLRSAGGLADGLGSRLGHDGCGLRLDRRSGLGSRCGIGRRSVTGRTAAAGRALGPVTAVGAGAAARRARGRGLLASELLGRDVTLVDPDLDADPAERRTGLVEAVVDVGPQRVQRDPTLAVELRAGHLRAAEATGALH